MMQDNFPEGVPDKCIEIERRVAHEVGGAAENFFCIPRDMKHMYLVFELLMSHIFSFPWKGRKFHSDVRFGFTTLLGVETAYVEVIAAALALSPTHGRIDYRGDESGPAYDRFHDAYCLWKRKP